MLPVLGRPTSKKKPKEVDPELGLAAQGEPESEQSYFALLCEMMSVGCFLGMRGASQLLKAFEAQKAKAKAK